MFVNEASARQTFQKNIPNSNLTYAQALYRTFADKTFNNHLNEEKLLATSNARENIKLRQELIRKTANEYFATIGMENLSDILFDELEKQKIIKQNLIKEEAVKNGMILWHATPLNKDELNGGVLKGTTERPDIIWENVFTGACAFPHSNGAYAIKKAKDENDFACKGENLVKLTDNRLENKANDEILGYIHGHVLTKDDGFMPTVSLDGSVSEEWTTLKEVSIDVTKQVTLESLRQNGVHIFAFDRKYSGLIKTLSKGKSIEEQILMLENMAKNNNKTFTDENGNQQTIKVQDYYNKQPAPDKGKTITELRGISSERKSPNKTQTTTISLNVAKLYKDRINNFC